MKEPVVTQTETAVPDLPEDASQPVIEGAAADAQPSSGFTLGSDDTALLDSYFGVNVRAAILKLYEKVLLSPHAKPGSLGSVSSEPITDRQLRGKLHQVIITQTP